MNFKAPKILEIGEQPLMQEAYPETTEHWSTRPQSLSLVRPQDHIVTASQLPLLFHKLRDTSFDLIVIQPTNHSPWSIQWISRSLFRRSTLRGDAPYFRAFGQELARGRLGAPLAIWDWEDQPFIFRHNLFLLNRANLYFKRELPPDHWRVLMSSGHYRVPTTRIRLNKRYQKLISKLRPISLGLPLGRESIAMTQPLNASKKRADVFFAGRVEDSSTVRLRGFEEIRSLQRKGIRVDIPDNNLTVPEFLDRCAQSWLVWCPEGHGYETFRAYEAAICGAVPIINRLTVDGYLPLRNGTHCFYYDIEPGGLTSAIENALQDRPKLISMGHAAREFVLAHHTQAKLAQYIAETTLGSGLAT